MASTWYPHLTVATVVEKEGKYLLVDEIADGMRVINQPAGHLEEGETLAQAATRETLEETGWNVEILHIVGLYLYTSPHNGVTYFRCCFAGKAVSCDNNAQLDEGIIGPLWLTLDELRQRQSDLRSPLVIQCIEDFMAGNHIPLEYLSHSLAKGRVRS